jgi:hypothetical protein
MAIFVLCCFSFELCSMASFINDPKNYLTRSPSDYTKDLSEIYFEGVKPIAYKTHWFARNYNLFYLIRFGAIIMLIFNMQYQQIFQVVGSLIVMLSFSLLTFFYSCKIDFFSSWFTKVFRLIQEVSMTIIVILINIFCFDTFKFALTNRQKVNMMLLFITLLILNIILELSSSFINICILLISGFAKKQKIANNQKIHEHTEQQERELFNNKERIKQQSRHQLNIEQSPNRRVSIQVKMRRGSRLGKRLAQRKQNASVFFNLFSKNRSPTNRRKKVKKTIEEESSVASRDKNQFSKKFVARTSSKFKRKTLGLKTKAIENKR